MKSNSLTPSKILNFLFAVGEAGIVTITVGFVAMLCYPKIGDVELFSDLNIGAVGFRLDDATLHLKSTTIKAEAIRVDHVRGIVTIKNPENIDVIRWPQVILMLVRGATGVTLFELLRRIFKQVANREVFTTTNLSNVRRLGLVLITYAVCSAPLDAWLGQWQTEYLKREITIRGATFEPVAAQEPAVYRSGDFILQANFNALLFGLFVLAAREVLREGRKLKEENELTV